MKVVANRREGYQLLQDGIIELANVEANGIRIDMRRLEATKEDLKDKIRDLRAELQDSKLWRVWSKRFADKAKLKSHSQLSVVLFEEMGFKANKQTESGKDATDEEALQNLGDPYVTKWVRMMKYDKALGTFLSGIEQETVNGRLHPVFNLHTVQTYRSSSDSPNFQNFPVRDKEIAKIIRSLMIPSEGCVLPENDFKGIEVCVSACYHQDKNFISYITTPGKDMHGDMAQQLYMIDKDKVSKETFKDARYGAKNKFVFPQFYGDYYVACAKNLWEWIEKGKLKGPGDIPLAEHLADQGIDRLGACDPEQKPKKGTFEAHVQAVEDDFWNNRFIDYGRWRKEWYQQYLDKGYFDMYSGFRVEGVFNRNAVCNYPIQGSAFHCLLWTLIQVNRKLRKYRMLAKIVGQIHDSMIGDVPERELRDYWDIIEETVTVELRKHYSWLIVPLEVEYEIPPSHGTWFDKKEVKFKDGKFKHPEKEIWTEDPLLFIETLDNIKAAQ